MEHPLTIYNTLTRTKEQFIPLSPPFAGLYVCGPTVYGDPHLGHARPAITFDIVFRYLKHLGYKVRYIRNITDVGHLEADQDEGEDKIAKKARIEKMEPMEVAQYYSDRYYHFMERLNILRPSIEPRASGHMIEQIAMIEKILAAGYAYIVNGSVYFDIIRYNEKFNYGKLSGRILEDLITNTRELEGQDEKRNPVDFALWKKAQPEHIMHWPSPWSEGFPGWHLECSAMSTKYLGEVFDIHGGGMDLLFPHHECEIAQSTTANGKESVRYWMHNNMITINGQKMGKSLGNFITLDQFFTGNHPALEKAYSPMTIRFFILQSHYRSTLDFSNEALQAADKGLKKLLAGIETLNRLIPLPVPLRKGEITNPNPGSPVSELGAACYAALNDDFNTPVLIAKLFEGVRIINTASDKSEALTPEEVASLKQIFNLFVYEILGLTGEKRDDKTAALNGLMDLVLQIRESSREKKDWPTSDKIRNTLSSLGILVKDKKDGATWTIE